MSIWGKYKATEVYYKHYVSIILIKEEYIMKWKGFRPAYIIRQELHLTVWQRIKRVFL